MIEPTTAPERAITAWMQKARERFPRAYAPWTPEEDDLLRDLAARNASPPEMEAALGRGPGGLNSRLAALGLAPEAAAPRPRSRGCGLPVPQMDWVPEWRDHLPEQRWVKETARFWGVEPEALDQAMEALGLDAWTVFVLRYGLAGRCSYTVDGIADLLDLRCGEVARLQQEAEETVRRSLASRGQEPAMVSLEETLARRVRRRRTAPAMVAG